MSAKPAVGLVATRYALKLTPPAVVLEYAEKGNPGKSRLRTVRRCFIPLQPLSSHAGVCIDLGAAVRWETDATYGPEVRPELTWRHHGRTTHRR